MSQIITVNVDRNVSFRDYRDIEGKKLRVAKGGLFYTFQGEGPMAGTPCVFLRLAGCNIGAKEDCPWCFPAGEEIHTARGKVRFDQVRVGDSLYTLNEEGQVVLTRVKRVLKRDVAHDDLVCVQYRMPGARSTKRVYCTKEHPFHTTTRGYVPAGELTPEDEIYHVSGYDMVAANKRVNNPMADINSVKKMTTTTEERRASGEIGPIVRTEEQRAKYSASKTGDKNPMKRPEVALASAIGHTYPKSGLEKNFEEGFELAGIKARYVGDNSLPIGSDEVGFKMPDFKLKGKKIIEVYHSRAGYMKGANIERRTPANYEKIRRTFYSQFGYDVMFLTEKDLPKVGSGNARTASDWKPIKEKIGMFEKNGASIVAVRPLTTTEFNKRKNKKNRVSVVNFSCGPENTFLVGGLHTHNCDTKFFMDEGVNMELEDVMDKIIMLSAGRTSLIVVTGGEPLLQTASLEAFRGICEPEHFHMQLETNGYFVKDDTLPGHSIVISPKIPHNKATYLPYKQEWVDRRAYMKYVVTTDPTSPYHTLPEDVLADRRMFKEIYVSAMCVYKRACAPGEIANIWDETLVDREATAANYQYAAEIALSMGLKVSYQTHLFAAAE